jgi:PAS domain S-box-containing protein
LKRRTIISSRKKPTKKVKGSNPGTQKLSAKTPGRKKSVRVAGQRSKRSLVVRRKGTTHIRWPSELAQSIPLLTEDIVATIREPLLVLDEDLRVVFANRSFYETFQVKPKETESLLLFDLGNRQWNIPQLRKLLKGILPKKATIEHFEVNHDFPKIGRKTILLNARQVHDGGSNFILLAMEDVTERKRMDEIVSESERKYRFLYEESFAFNVVVGFDETVLDINRAALEHLGYHKKEVLGKPIWDFVVKEEKEKVKKLLAQALEGKLSKQEKVSLQARDGSIHTILFAPKELRLEDADAVTGMVFTGMDITERKKMDDALRENEVRFRTLFQGLPLSTVVFQKVGSDFVIKDYNQSSQSFTGGKMQQFVGKSARELYRSRPDILEKFSIALEKKTTQTYETFYHMMSTDKDIFLELTLAYVPPDKIILHSEDITERKKAEEALRESEERLNRAEEIANLGSWELDLINDRLSWSDEVYRIFGLVPQEFEATYEAFLEAVHPDDRKAVDAAYSGSLREGKDCYEIEHRIVRKLSGEVRIVREKCEHIRDKNGRIVRSVGMVQDITEQKLAERKIKDLARFPTENPSPVLRIDKEGNILYANPASRTLLEEWGTTLGGSVPSDWQKLVTEVINSGNDKTVEIEHKGKILSLQLVALPGADDVNVYGRDITELKKVSSELRKERDILEIIKEHANAHLAYLDPDFNFVRVNSMYARGVGYKPDELIGKNYFDLFPDEQNRAIFRKVKNKGEPIEFRAKPLVSTERPEGSVTYWDWALTPVKDDSGQVVGLELSMIDITDIKRAEDEIRTLNESLEAKAAELAASNQELEAFTYSVSHDLRAPLRSVSGFSRALLEDYENKLDEEGKDYLRRVRRASGRMQQLIDDLLNLSRIQRSELKHTKVNLSQLAQSVVKTLTKASHRRKIDFAIKENVEATGDKNLLRVVLDNLLRNAWKFTSRCERAKIEFGTKLLDGQTIYFVRDNGVGFDPGYSNKLFVPFQRLHSISEFPGSGIGLATVKRIINRHGGRVWAEGELEKGATFYFTL